MKRALLLLFWGAPVLAVSVYLFAGAGAFRSPGGDGILIDPGTSEQDPIPAAEQVPVHVKENGGKPQSGGGGIAAGFSSPQQEVTTNTWGFEPGMPFPDSHLLAKSIASSDRDNPPMIAGLDIIAIEKGSSPRGGGGLSSGSGSPSTLGGGGAFSPGVDFSGDLQTDPPILDPTIPTDEGPPVIFQLPPNPGSPRTIPEPGTLILLVAGLAGLLWIGRRRER